MNVYDREIPKDSLDIYMTSPPCQAFSMAGKRLGKEDARGILFFNSLEFIQVNNPRFFIFENVRGLLSHDKENKKDKIGRTFKEWIDYLGGKSVNGVTNMMPIDGAVPYHLHYKVLNAKKHGVPQNRERVFLIGIRDDQDNTFTWPAEEELTKRLKDVLEDSVDDKYFLSNERIDYLVRHQVNKNILIDDIPNESKTCIASYYKSPRDCQYLKVTNFQGSEISNTIRTGGKGSMTDKHNWDTIKIKSGTAKGYDEATEGDSINLSFPGSETRIGRVGKQVAQTLDTACNQGVMIGDYRTDEGFRWRQDGNSPCLMASMRDKWSEKFTAQNPPITTCNQAVIQKTIYGRHQQDCFYDSNGIIGTIPAGTHGSTPHLTKTLMPCGTKIRRLTPRECFRLMDFPDTFTWPVSDSQAYKQAGNSIVVRVLEKIINNLPI
jgi:DNA (cytosine-5)-methyltransferase 1